MKKITKDDIKQNLLNCILIPMYAVILSVVYVSWIYYTVNWLWLEILLAIIFISTGIVLAYLSTLKRKKLNEESEQS